MPSPLGFIHPFPLDASFWDELIRELPRDRDMHSVGFPGFGGVEPLQSPSIVGHADAVASQIRGGDGPAVLVGCSMGGFVALSIVARHPECVSGLVLTGTAAGGDPPERRAERDGAIELIAREGHQEFVAEFAASLPAQPVRPALARRIEEMTSRTSAPAVSAAIAALRDRPDRRPDLAHIAVPTLVVAGADDPRTPREAMVELAEQVPDARMVLVADAGHLAPLEQPRAVAEHIIGYLNEDLREGPGRPTR